MGKENLSRGPRKGTIFKTGLALVFLAAVLWVSILAIPFIDISAVAKTSVVIILVVAAEITGWLGVVLVGKEAFQRFKEGLRRKKQNKE